MGRPTTLELVAQGSWNPNVVGAISEGMVLAHLVKMGYVVLMPFGSKERYDFVIEAGDGKFVRAQVKTGRLNDGVIGFYTCSQSGKTLHKTSYIGSADVFLVYCPETEQVFRVPVDECGPTRACLRVDPAKGGSISTIRWAADYLLTPASSAKD